MSSPVVVGNLADACGKRTRVFKNILDSDKCLMRRIILHSQMPRCCQALRVAHEVLPSLYSTDNG